ncbi:MAG: hypothetical protein J6C28_02725 [Bacilli bacterium]|nr:hypothetical protein [Bacilli bacterium]
MKYCTGPIKNMYVKSMGVNEKIGEIVTESIVLQKNAPFYWNPLGRLVSFEYNTFLPTKSEAETFVEESAKRHPGCLELATCMYADYGHMTVHEISRKEFKQLKKTYKEIRKQKKSS